MLRVAPTAAAVSASAAKGVDRGGIGQSRQPRPSEAYDAAVMVFPWQKRNVPPELADRVPPGQVLTEKFPVLHFGRVPSYGDLSGWDFRVWGEVAEPFSPEWAEFRNLPVAEQTLDIHCVTRWSKLDTRWEGVAFSHIAEVAQPSKAARFVIFHAEGGFTSNVPMATAMRPECMLAWSYDGQPLEPDHGYPLRAIVPGTYFWKSAKWLRGVEFSAEDQLGFWERNGYHNDADPWKEQRYSSSDSRRRRPSAWRARSARRRAGRPCGRSRGSARSSTAR